MKTAGLLLTVVFLMVPLQPAPAEPDLLREGLSLLSESAREPCPVCAKEKRQEAFEILNDELKPGRLFEIAPPRRLVRTELCGENELQLVAADGPIPLFFRFHTAERHLVGVSQADYTEERLDRVYAKSQVGSAYKGELIAVPFRYGDGPTYSYFHSDNRLEVHCRILSLQELDE